MSRHDIQSSIMIRASPEHIFKIASDIARVKDWLPNVTSAKNVGAKKGVGAERVMGLRLHNHDIVSRQRITGYEPGVRFAWIHLEDHVDGKPFDMLEDIGTDLSFEAQGAQTEVAAVAHFRPKGFKARLAVPLVVHDIKKQIHTALENLKRICEEG